MAIQRGWFKYNSTDASGKLTPSNYSKQTGGMDCPVPQDPNNICTINSAYDTTSITLYDNTNKVNGLSSNLTTYINDASSTSPFTNQPPAPAVFKYVFVRYDA